MGWFKRKAAGRGALSNEGRTIIAGGSALTSSHDISQLLEECVALCAPAVMLVHGDAVAAACQVRFLALTSGCLTFNLTGDQTAEDTALIAEATFCVVAFTHDRRAHQFVAPILDHRPGQISVGELPQFDVGLPALIADVEARMSFRVPVVDSRLVSVSVSTAEGKTWKPTPVDISLTGMLLAFSADEDPEFKPGIDVVVEVEADNCTVSLKGCITPRGGKALYSVYFPDVVDAGAPPNTDLRAIVLALEKEWIRKREA